MKAFDEMCLMLVDLMAQSGRSACTRMRANQDEPLDICYSPSHAEACGRGAGHLVSALDIPTVNTSEQVRLAQEELSRLGCFSGAIDGALNDATSEAIRRYLRERGAKPSSDVEITDDFIAELKKETARVCPLVCAPGTIAEGEKCVAEKPGPIARPKREDEGSKPRHAEVERTPAPRHEPPPRASATRAPSGGSGGGGDHGSITIGVGF